MIDVPQNVAHCFTKLYLQLIQCSRYQCPEHAPQSACGSADHEPDQPILDSDAIGWWLWGEDRGSGDSPNWPWPVDSAPGYPDPWAVVRPIFRTDGSPNGRLFACCRRWPLGSSDAVCQFLPVKKRLCFLRNGGSCIVFGVYLSIVIRLLFVAGKVAMYRYYK